MDNKVFGRIGFHFSLPVRAKLMTAMLVLALVPLIIVGALVINRLERVLQQQMAADSEALTRERAGQLSQEISRLQNISYSMAAAQTTRFLGADNRQREEYVNNLLDSTPGLSRLALIDQEGAVMARAPRHDVGPVMVPETARTGWFTAQVSVETGSEPQYQIFAPVVFQNQVRTVVFLSANLRALVTQAQLPRANDGAYLTVTDKDGTVLYSTMPGYEDVLRGVNLSSDPQVNAAMQGQTTSGWSHLPSGEVFLAAAPAKVGDMNWIVTYAVPSSKALGTVSALRGTLTNDLALVTGVLVLIVLAFGLLLSNQLVSPILKVVRVMGRVREGDLEARVPAMGNDELGTLGNDLNDTLDSIVSLVQTRQERDQLQRSITRLLDEVAAVGSGDLTVQAQVTADQTGAIADAFNYMIEELRGLVQRTQETAGQVSGASSQVTVLSERMVASAEEQARRLGEARASVTTMTGLMNDVRTTVGESVAAADEARSAVEAGQEAVNETMDAMGRLRNEARETAKKIKRLGESSQEIGEIVRLINEIADQTHLLALNASIQAAMAGAHGRGFAVVAEEVRSLAERSGEATEKIDELINAIQADTNAAMVAMERSTQEVVTGSRLADKAGKALTAIGDVTERIVGLSAQIETVVESQFQSARTLETTVGEVASATIQATDEVRSVAQGMQQLSEMAGSLRDSVSVFRVDDTPEVSDEAASPVAA
jgi:methyl-accepting chemotaxis protein